MINLRYHIVSITAIFLAIGIGLTLGSTFLDRATVDNLQGQLENLESKLEERNGHIDDLQTTVDRDARAQQALDEQGSGLLAGQIGDVPVVVMAARGVDERDVDGTVRSLLVAGADVQGLWWFTERMLLTAEADVADLAGVVGETSDDPSRVRRAAIAALGGEIRARQNRAPDVLTDELDDLGSADATTTTEPGQTPPSGEGTVGDPETTTTVPGRTDAELEALVAMPIADRMVEAGFIDFQPVPGGADVLVFPAGTRIVLVGGSSQVPDDVVVLPLIERLARAARDPVPVVVGSARRDAGDSTEVADVVSVIREDDSLRSLVPTVDALDHFHDWAAVVLALDDVGDGLVGHYGLGEGATRLLPPLQVS